MPLEKRVEELFQQVRRRLRTMGEFRTASGTVIRIVERDRQSLHLVGTRAAHNAREERDPGFTLQLSNVRVAIVIVVRRGYVDRKDLEGASPYTSAVMGILISFVPDIMVVRLYTGRFLIRLRMTRVYIGGLEREGDRMFRTVAEAGGGFVLFSHYHLRKRRTPGIPAYRRHMERYGLEAMYDSGTFSLSQAVKKAARRGLMPPPIDWEAECEAYCDWVLEEKLAPYTYLQFDPIGNPEATRRYLLRMLKRGLCPIPVYHYGSGEEELDWLVRQGFPVIALGNTVGVSEAQRVAWAQEVMTRHPPTRVNYHGLAFCSLAVATLEFFSVDGTAQKHGRAIPSRDGRRGGRILTDLGQREATTPGEEAVAHNIAYMVRLGQRKSANGVQLDLQPFVDGWVRGPDERTA